MGQSHCGQGLPFPNVTVDSAGDDGAVWIGTINGASRYYKVGI